MGSEHYCLRWNNHQSNLLGVFSQLLQDESLVDVTLACSEGALIKAHKVVLSACSSYFQSLFLDHPEKHPIVILKDVRLAELKTLVEFMYKGEVNVQYCQLSALLKTAESLKVKGLAEMTNQNTTLREPEREPDRLRPHSQPSKSTCDSPVDTTVSGGGPNTSSIASSIASSTNSKNIGATSLSASATSAISNSTTTAATTSTPVSTAAAVVAAAAAAVAAANQQHHHQHQQSTTSSTTTSTTSTLATTGRAGIATTASTAHKRDASGERGGLSPSAAPPTKRQQMSPERDSSPLPLNLYQGRNIESSANAECGGSGIRSEERATTAMHHNANKSNNNNIKHTSSSGLSGVSADVSHHNNGHGETKSRRRNDTDDDDNDNENAIRGGVGGVGDSPPARPSSCNMLTGLGVVEKIEEPDSYDEEMELDEDVDDNSSNDAMGLNMKIGAAISHSAASLALPSPLGGGSGGGGGDPESARSTPAAATGSSCGGLILASDLIHQQQQQQQQHRATSRSPRDIGGGGLSIERPSSSGICGAGMSPCSSSNVAAATPNSESLAGTSGLGPVQSVPLSLKKEIDCSEDDNSNSRHMHQPRSASAGGGLGGDLDYRLTTHESETSDSPHVVAISGSPGRSIGGGGVGGAASCSTSAAAAAAAIAASAASTSHHLDQPQTPPPLYPCMYCGHTFQHQSKLTRHILSHSLKTLEYRETAQHPLLHTHLLPHDLNMAQLPQFTTYQMNAALAASGAETQEQAAAAVVAAAMELDFAAVMAATCGSVSARSALDLDGSGRGGGGGGGGSTSGNGGGGVSAVGSSSLVLSGAGSSSSSTSAAAVAAAAAAAAAAASSSASGSLLGPSSSGADPNSVVLCKFCGKSFPDVTTLITHLPVHTGERPFKCEFCGKAFKLRHHMKDHCRVHTGERPFRCEMCGKTFSRSTILKAHEKTHFPKYVRKFLSPSPVDTKDELPQ